MCPLFGKLRRMRVPKEQLAGCVALAELHEHLHQNDDATAHDVISLPANGWPKHPGAAELLHQIHSWRNDRVRATRAAYQLVPLGNASDAVSLLVV